MKKVYGKAAFAFRLSLSGKSNVSLFFDTLHIVHCRLQVFPDFKRHVFRAESEMSSSLAARLDHDFYNLGSN